MNPICNSVHVRVPATSANLGSGFDTVGLALDYHDELTFTLNDDPNDGIAHVIIHGEGADALPCDETHLVVSTFRRACATFGLGRLGFTLEATNNIPQARGMGSSAEAIVAGIAAAAAFAQTGDLNRPAIFDMAAQQGKSGVAAAPAQDADTCACSGGTRESAFADELAAAQAQSNALLFTATQDNLHQPYRGALMPPSTELIALFRSKGYAAAVSGAGPCVLVLHYGNAREAIDQIASEQLASGHWRVLHLPINTAGVEIERR